MALFSKRSVYAKQGDKPVNKKSTHRLFYFMSGKLNAMIFSVIPLIAGVFKVPSMVKDLLSQLSSQFYDLT